ncbi:MAG: SRPBCC family protein [Actinomycetota bacterium]|nr:SRPBCC family protein [Actinomycetota bacterium]
MELINEFTVNVPIDEAWDVLTDVTRIAPAMPGAKLEGVEGDEYRGVVKVKVGPVTAEYRGAATFVERDASSHRAVLRAEGRETRGQGNATATITATLAPVGEGTKVSVLTDLSVTGRVAQFGRGVLADVSNKLLGQFVASLERTVLGGGATSGSKSAEGSAPGESGAPDGEGSSRAEPSVPSPSALVGVTEVKETAEAGGAPGESRQLGKAPGVPGEDREVVPVDIMRVAGPAIAKRALPVVLVLAAAFILARRRMCRRRRRTQG